MNSIIEWWKNKQKYMKVLIIAVVFDLLALVVTFILNKPIFFIVFLLTILILIYFIPTLYLIRVFNQPISPKKYYLKTVEDHYMHMDENLLTKMFEIRINNQRTFLFAVLSLLMTLTLTLAFNSTAYNYFDKPFIIDISSAKLLIALGEIGILAAVYYAFGFDRETLKELETLFNAKERLKQLKKVNLTSEENVEKQGEKADILGKIQT